MSSREPLWFCHECHTEMRPAMMPDPHCTTCNSTFVEKLENSEDDPRQFQPQANGPFESGEYPPRIDDFLFGLQSLLGSGGRQPTSPSRSASVDTGARPTNTTRGIRIEFGGDPRSGRRTVVLGGPNTLGGSGSPRPDRSGGTSSPATMSEFLRSGPGAHDDVDGGITPAMMAQYLLALMSQGGVGGTRGGIDPMAAMLGLGVGDGEGPANGRWGDYVFGQEALDQIITQLMENSNSTRPVPATEEIMVNLPRTVLVEKSPLLEQDCAVCKETFKINHKEPDEMIVVTLPCKHAFHEGCIMPWLKSSGTCPVCRHQLVPQPQHHAPGPGPQGDSGGDSSGSGSSPRPGSRSNSGRSGSGSGFARSFFGSMTGGSSGDRSQGGHRRGASGGNSSRLPGGWGDELD